MPSRQTGLDHPQRPDLGRLLLDLSHHERPETGWESAEQAALHGDREAFIARLVLRHELTKDLAVAVADRRLTLLEAVRSRERSHPGRAARAAGRVAAWGGLLLLLSLFFAMSYELSRSRQDDAAAPLAERRRSRALEAATSRDDLGRLTEVRGSDPTRVLQSYCAAQRCEAREVVLPAATPAVRLGVFVPLDSPAEPRAIAIERRGGAHDWVVGGEGAPIVPIDVPDLPEGTPRFRVR